MNIQITVGSVKQIQSELMYIVKHHSVKLQKRIERLRLVSNLLCEDFVGALAPENDLAIGHELITEYLRGSTDITPGKFIISSRNELDYAIRKIISANLTACLNHDGILYGYTSSIIADITRKIQPIIYKYGSKNIIVVHKGSMAQRLALLNAFPEAAEEINRVFKCESDNDCTVLINPRLSKFAKVHAVLSEIIYNEMLSQAETVNMCIDTIESSAIDAIVEAGQMYDVRPATHPHCSIKPIACGCGNRTEQTKLTVSDVRAGVYAVRNMSVKFADISGNVLHFALMRYKRAYKVYNRTIGAEILDISIPYNDDYIHRKNFCKYVSGEFITTVSL
jgi:hypothetical protein